LACKLRSTARRADPATWKAEWHAPDSGAAPDQTVRTSAGATAVTEAIKLGCSDAAAIGHLAGAPDLLHARSAIVELGALSPFERPLPVMTNYDELLGQEDRKSTRLNSSHP
jgi:hypothetical protein